MVKDMTVGNPTKLILSFSIPLLIGNVFQQFYNMVDTMIVGRFIGVEALAALGATGSLNFLVVGFIIGITSGFAVPIAQIFGAGEEDKLRHYVVVSSYLCIIFSIVITLVMVFSVKNILTIMQTPSDIFENAYSYIKVICGGVTATIAYNMLSSILRSLGDSKTPLYFLIIGSILNVILDIVLIVNFKMGVAGAAYATVASQAVSALLCLIYMSKKFKVLRFKKKDLGFDLKTSMTLLKIGMPMALQFSITASGSMILQGAINSFGSTIVAAYTAASKVEQILMQPAITLGTTMATYTGQNLGAERYDRIEDGIKRSVRISIIFSIIAGIIIVMFGTDIAKLFISVEAPEVMKSAKQYLNTVALFFIPLGLLFVYRHVLQGLGEGMITMYAGISELVGRLIVGFFLSKYLGYTAICLAGPAAWIAAAVLLIVCYYKKAKSFNLKESCEEMYVN